MPNRVVERVRSRLNPRLRAHSGLLGAAVLVATLIAPAASAVEPMIEGGDETGFGPAASVAPSDPPLTLPESTSGFDWSAALLVLLIGLAVFGIVVALHPATTRRRSQVAARAPFAP